MVPKTGRPSLACRAWFVELAAKPLCARTLRSLCRATPGKSCPLRAHQKTRFAIYIPDELVPVVQLSLDNGRVLQELLHQSALRYTKALKHQKANHSKGQKMTRIADPQINFADIEFLTQGIDLDHLKRMSDFLDDQPKIFERVRRDLQRGLKKPDTGRTAMTPSQVLRSLILMRVGTGTIGNSASESPTGTHVQIHRL